ncbi:MAG: MarR family transcriptional regulator [Deltaproteobacteria bacterium]|nr:MarR family transcriptional regulator [Deltaproteobacteria bacterium]
MSPGDGPAFVEDFLAIYRLFGGVEREEICRGTVTVAQCFAFQVLLSGPREMSALAAALGSSTSATTRLVEGMVRRGWVERCRTEDDRRKVIVELTASGVAQAEQLRQATISRMDAVMEQIPASERHVVCRATQLLREALEDRCPPSPS